MSATAPSKTPEPSAAPAAAMKQCPSCNASVPAASLKRHVEWQCPAALVGCNECDQQVPRGQLQRHLKLECKDAETVCPFYEHGCKAKIGRALTDAMKRSKIAEHMNGGSGALSHAKMLMFAVDHQRALRLELQKQVDDRAFDLSTLSKELAALQREVDHARATRSIIQKQLVEFDKTVAEHQKFVDAKVAAMPAAEREAETASAAAAAAASEADGIMRNPNAPAASSLDKKADSAPVAAAAAALSAKEKEKAEKQADSKGASGAADSREYADARRGADQLVIAYETKTAATPPLADALPKINLAIAAIKSNGKVTITDVKLLEHVRSYRVSEYPSYTERKAAADFLMTFYAVRGMSIQDEKAFAAMMLEQRRDLPLMYALANVQSNDMKEVDLNHMDQYLLDICTRLPDGRRMTEVFDRVMARGVSTLNKEETVSMFVFAGILGRWKLVREIGARVLAAEPTALQALHDASSQNPSSPDMEILYNLSVDEQGKARPEVDQKDLRWAQYGITSLRIKLLNVEHPDPKVVETLKREFGEFPEGKDLCDESPTGTLALVSSGAYAQLTSTSAMPIVMIGPMTGSRLILSGYGAMEDSGARIRQEEKFVLNRSASDPDIKQSTCTGAYTMTQVTSGVMQPGMSAGTLKASFEAMAILVEEETATIDSAASMDHANAAARRRLKPAKRNVLVD